MGRERAPCLSRPFSSCRMSSVWSGFGGRFRQQSRGTEREHALSFGDPLAAWFLSFCQCFGSGDLVAFDTTGRGGFLGLAGPDGGLRRDGALALLFPFLGAVLSRF